MKLKPLSKALQNKAHYASKKSGYPALSDDSGLEVDCLNGAPGVFTANWAETKREI